MKQKFYLDLRQAKNIASAAAEKARESAWSVVIAIVDDGGHLIYLERDQVQVGSINVAIDKSRAALLFQRPTKYWAEAAAQDRTGCVTMPGMLALEGGLPLVYQNQVVGAIGVSGVRGHEDSIVAQAGVDALAAD